MALLHPDLIEVAEEARRRFVVGADSKLPGVREWLVRGGTYYVTNSSAKNFQVSAVDNSWADANGADVVRYLWAARESLLPRSASDYDSRSLGWGAVTTYYSAFYLTLAFLRMFGRGLVFLSADDTQKLSSAPNVVHRLANGAYAFAISLGAPTVLELKQRNVQGFHEGFWRFADDCLKDIGGEIQAGKTYAMPFSTAKRNEAFLSIERFRDWLGKPGVSGREIGWMSTLRNDVNYRLTREVWAPNFRDGGATASRLKQDIMGIVRGTRNELGVQLRMDRDIRAMTERVCIMFRDMSRLEGFPRF